MPFSNQILEKILRAFGALIALACGRFLASDRSTTPELILIFVFSLLFITLLFLRRRRKKSMILFFIFFFLLCLFSCLLRFFIMDFLFAFIKLPAALIFGVSSTSNESENSARESGSLPRLESESSSESLNTFRNLIAAENEAEIYRRIRFLENGAYYNLPPQNTPGDYAALVRENFNSAINVAHFRSIFDREYFELQVLERKGLVQDKLLNLMLEEENIEEIFLQSPYSNIRKEAYHFLEDKLQPVGDPRHAFQRNLLEGSLRFFLQDLAERGKHSSVYQDFLSYFLDSD